jgi:glucokinase
MQAGRSPAPYPRLVGDVGGTEHRFGWIDAPGADVSSVVASAGDAGLADAIAGYLAMERLPTPASAAIGVAAPVQGDVVRMTNRDWQFSIAALKRDLGVPELHVLNDFTVLAHALSFLREGEARQIGGGAAVADAAMALLGPGTGLGVSGLVPTPVGPAAIVGEGGHSSLAAANAREEAVIALLRARFGHVSGERVVSGPGLVNLHAALLELSGLPPQLLAPTQISERASSGNDAVCGEAMDLFFAWLGSIAGDLALTLGARGGVFIGGGIPSKLGNAIDRSSFRERFEAKGRYRQYLRAIPTFVLIDPAALALRGANAVLG